MALIEEFLSEIDRRWKPAGPTKIKLDVIGSGALMLQTNYARRTKDSDVLETRILEEKNIRDALMALAGKGSDLHKHYGIYLDIVQSSLPFLPHSPLFHSIKTLEKLRHFEIRALDIADVVVSKLHRFNANDRSDIREMIQQNRISHQRLIERFRLAVDQFEMDARAEDLPKYIENLHAVEQTYFNVPKTPIELPGWLGEG